MGKKEMGIDIFKYIPSMAVGFLAYAAYVAFPLAIKNTITWCIMIAGAVITYLLFGRPGIIPILIVLAGIITNFSKKRIPQTEQKPKKIRWWNFWLFGIIFIAAAILSERARLNDWPNRKPINLFENTYRMGSLVFGGGQVLIPMMYEQWSVRPDEKRVKNKNPNVVQIDEDDMLTGMGIVRAVPGPVFSVASFTGGMAMRDEGKRMQLLGCFIGMIAIFLPSALLVLFFFPIWNNLKKYAAVYRSIEGVNAVVVGIMIASTVYIMRDISTMQWDVKTFINMGVMLGTFITLSFTKIPPPFIVLGCLLLGYLL
jgi:chromate transporter